MRAQPTLATQISAQTAAPGTEISDTVMVNGLAGQTVTIQAALYGPYTARDQIKCEDTPVWTGTVEATGDGEYVTAPVKLDAPGYYTYRESIAESDTIAAVQTACAEASETTIIRGTPSDHDPGQRAGDNARRADHRRGDRDRPWQARGHRQRRAVGPVPDPRRDHLRGHAVLDRQLPGDRRRHVHHRPGHADRGRLLHVPRVDRGDRGLRRRGHELRRGVGDDDRQGRAAGRDRRLGRRGAPGRGALDTLDVTGLGKTPVKVDVELFGPYASRADIDCAGAPYWKGTVDAAAGDGKYTSPETTVRRVGFYVFREKIAGTETVAAHQAECQVEAETSLAAPAILGGRGDNVAYVAQGGGGPSRVKLARLGIDAQVSAIGIDMKSGALGIPDNIKRVGWWRDGATPGDEAGTALLAGHVDSAKSGAGAFYALKSARRGDTVTVTQGGKTLRYRVTTIKVVRKAALPTSIYTRTGSPKLVLVTCGGPFDAKAGHYRDNIVVTACPRMML